MHSGLERSGLETPSHPIPRQLPHDGQTLGADLGTMCRQVDLGGGNQPLELGVVELALAPVRHHLGAGDGGAGGIEVASPQGDPGRARFEAEGDRRARADLGEVGSSLGKGLDSSIGFSPQ